MDDCTLFTALCFNVVPSCYSNSSLGFFFLKCDNHQCLRPDRSFHRAPDEVALWEIRTHLFHRACHWHAVLHCHPAAAARGLTSGHAYMQTFDFYALIQRLRSASFMALPSKISQCFPPDPLIMSWCNSANAYSTLINAFHGFIKNTKKQLIVRGFGRKLGNGLTCRHLQNCGTLAELAIVSPVFITLSCF